MLDKAQASAGPIAILTHKAATVAGHSPTAHVQVVVQASEAKKVLHLAVYLRGDDTIEVKQRGQVLTVLVAQTVEIMIELYEETAPASLFLNFLKKDGIGTVLGDLRTHYTPQVARPHRVTGEVPTRIVRCFGSVPTSKLLQALALSGQQDCIIKPCQRHVEEQFNLTNVWASSSDRTTVMQQISSIKHQGVVRTRATKFIIRCTLEQVALVRQHVASDDLRYDHTPALVVSRKWKIPIGPSCSGTKALTWTVTLGSGYDGPPQDQVLIDNSICLIVELGAKAPIPQATMSVVIHENLRQVERTLSSAAQGTIVDLVEENVDKRFERLTSLEDQVAKLSAHLAHADANTQIVGQQVAHLAQSVEQRQSAMQTEMKDITNTLEAHRSHTDQVIKQLDDSFLLRMKELGNELVTQLKPDRKRQTDVGGSDLMESRSYVALARQAALHDLMGCVARGRSRPSFSTFCYMLGSPCMILSICHVLLLSLLCSDKLHVGSCGSICEAPFLQELSCCYYPLDAQSIFWQGALLTFVFALGPSVKPLPCAVSASRTFGIRLMCTHQFGYCGGAFNASQLARQLVAELRGSSLGPDEDKVALEQVRVAPLPSIRPGELSSSRQFRGQDLPVVASIGHAYC
eukprot:3165946-Amphidinium_carterae.1